MSARVCLVWLLVCAVLVSGCSDVATITRKDGVVQEMEIHDGDQVYIYGFIYDKDGGGRTYDKVSRSSVEDIDHPGDVQIVLGSLAAVLGIVSVVALIEAGPQPWGDVFLISELSGILGWVFGLSLASTLAVGGGGLVVDGGQRWRTSTDAASGVRSRTGLEVAPMVTRDERGDAVVGLGLGLTW